MKCLLKQTSCGCTLCQDPQGVTVNAEMPQDYETAFTICQNRKNKELAKGTGGAGGQFAVSSLQSRIFVEGIGRDSGFHQLFAGFAE